MAKLSDILHRATNLISNYIEETDVSLGHLGYSHGNLLGSGNHHHHPHQDVHTSSSRRSSNYGYTSGRPVVEGEVIYGKNNICIHSSSISGSEVPSSSPGFHVPGYLTVKVHKFLPFREDGDLDQEESTLLLSWVPNNVIQQQPKSITPDSSPTKSIRKISREESDVTEDEIASDLRTLSMSRSGSISFFSGLETTTASKSSTSQPNANEPIGQSDSASQPFPGTCGRLSSPPDSSTCSASAESTIPQNEGNNYNNSAQRRSVPGQTFSLTSRSRIGQQMPILSNYTMPTVPSGPEAPSRVKSESGVSSMFEEERDTSLRGRQVCSQVMMTNSNSPAIESICLDLREMKSLRLFFSSNEEGGSDRNGLNNNVNNGGTTSSSTGQLVIAARDGRFQVFHFHFGGLDRLVSVLEEWQFLKKRQKRRNQTDSQSSTSSSSVKGWPSVSSPLPLPASQSYVRQFSVYRPPSLKQDECHIEEGIYSELDEGTFYRRTINSSGQIEDPFKMRRNVFFGGVSPGIRKQVWPFLLKRFPYSSTSEERRETVKRDRLRYQELDSARMSMSSEEAASFWKRIQSTVEKDCPRTDRANPFFAGDDNENVLIMKRILLNYAFHNPSIGYTQGMSDLLAPLLIELRDESEAFWSFEGLMERTLFISSPKDSDMDGNLCLLRELLRVMNPVFYNHLSSLPDGLELLFTHRWLLLCFKREFPESAALKMWEAAWTRYQTDYFHLFVCLAVMAVYGEEVTDHGMKADEILFHFSSLSLRMNGDHVLKKARGLLYQFRSMACIPCSLKKLLVVSTCDQEQEQRVPSSPFSLLPLPAIECVNSKVWTGQSSSPSTAICQCTVSLSSQSEVNFSV